MPVIATFMGLIVKMYFQQAEHNPPHVHIEYAGMGCAVSIASGKILDGTLPTRRDESSVLGLKSTKSS